MAKRSPLEFFSRTNKLLNLSEEHDSVITTGNATWLVRRLAQEEFRFNFLLGPVSNSTGRAMLEELKTHVRAISNEGFSPSDISLLLVEVLKNSKRRSIFEGRLFVALDHEKSTYELRAATAGMFELEAMSNLAERSMATGKPLEFIYGSKKNSKNHRRTGSASHTVNVLKFIEGGFRGLTALGQRDFLWAAMSNAHLLASPGPVEQERLIQLRFEKGKNKYSSTIALVLGDHRGNGAVEFDIPGIPPETISFGNS